MTIQEIFALATPTEIIDQLKKRNTDAPDITTIKNEYDPLLHPVMSTTDRPNKTIYEDDGTTVARYENVARIPIAFQELIVKRSSSFLFGNPVTLSHSAEGDLQEQIVTALKRVLSSNHETTLNRQMGRHLMAATEVAEYWYTSELESPANLYGFESKFKLRHSLFSPLLGDSLYPLFDSFGDLIAFSREYEVNTKDDTTTYFETYTAEKTILYKQVSGGYEVVKDTKNPIGKIPVIYGYQGDTEWAKVQGLIERLEKLASNFADTNDYHASPTIIVQGALTGFMQKGEHGKVLVAEPGADAHYLSWDKAPESVRLEKEWLTEMIYTITQTPNITFENMKGLGAISGVALKLMFMDAHLKCEDKKEIVSEYLQRRINVLKAYLAMMNTKWASQVNTFDIIPEVTPYMITDEKSNVELMAIANGGLPVLSQKTSVEKSGLSINPEAEYDQIKAEATEQAKQKSEVFNQVY